MYCAEHCAEHCAMNCAMNCGMNCTMNSAMNYAMNYAMKGVLLPEVLKSTTEERGQSSLRFDRFIGQDHLKKRLMQLLENGVPGHAYVFSGAEGTGKRTLANLFAAHYICRESMTAPCGKCISCRTYAGGTNPDVVRIQSQGRQIGIDAIRALQEAFSLGNSYGKKLCMVEDAEKMNESAQNALLKTLEEPPENALLLMTTSSFDSLLPTIRSRVVRLPMDGYTNTELKHISEKSTGSRAEDFLLVFSQGNPGRMLRLQKSESFRENRAVVLNLLNETKDSLTAPGTELLWKYLSENREQFNETLQILQSLLRDLLASCENMEQLLINTDKTDTIRSVALRWSAWRWIDAIYQIDAIIQATQKNLNMQVAVDTIGAILKPMFDK